MALPDDTVKEGVKQNLREAEVRHSKKQPFGILIPGSTSL